MYVIYHNEFIPVICNLIDSLIKKIIKIGSQVNVLNNVYYKGQSNSVHTTIASYFRSESLMLPNF